jgi:hypothetical protein
MSKTRIVTALMLLALVAGAFALNRQGGAAAEAAPGGQHGAAAQPNGEGIPEHVTYDVLFRQMEALKRKADDLDRRGGGGDALRKFVHREAKLSDEQAQKLDRIQGDYMRTVARMDARAKQIIGEARALRPHGQLQEGEALPEPPQELKTLQERRNNLTLQARALVREDFGEQEFQRFGEYVKEHIARKLKPVQPRGGRPGEQDKEKPRK